MRAVGGLIVYVVAEASGKLDVGPLLVVLFFVVVLFIFDLFTIVGLVQRTSPHP